MGDQSLCRLSAVEAAAAIAGHEFRSEDLVRACLERIAGREAVVGAWAWLDPEQALAEARARDKERPRGPLHGIPVGVKDIIDTADMPTGYGSRLYAGFRPAWDAAAVAAAKRAGAVILGKTVTTEFAFFAPGKTANPLNPKHTPGGSSSGSAAAVADGMVPLAFASQTAASTTRPASFCGIVGVKPSYGWFPLAGVKPLAPAFDTLGLMARSVGDAWLMHQAIAENPYYGLGPVEPGALRLAVCRTPWWAEAEPAMAAALERVEVRLRAAGAKLAPLDLPADFAGLVDTHAAIMAHEAYRVFGFEHARHADRLSAQIAKLIADGRAITGEAHRRNLEAASAARVRVAALLADWDAIVAPAAAGEAPEGLGATGNPIFSRVWTLLRLPTVSVPCGTGPRGLPVGVQFLGRIGDDERVFRVARWAESVLG
jgi:amidase